MIEVLEGDAIERLREMPGESVQMCVTSPPYWGLRDYGTAAWEGGEDSCDHLKPFDAVSHLTTGLNIAKDPTKAQSNVGHKHEPYRNACGKCGARRVDSQLGLERTPEEYVGAMVAVFREVKRVLRHDGTLWLNLGDSYATTPTGNRGTKSGLNGAEGEAYSATLDRYTEAKLDRAPIPPGLKPKDLCGIPWRVAFGLQADGWWLRSDIIWAKPNPMPESVTDRPTKSHEYIFLLSKSASYFYDAEAIKEPIAQSTIEWGNGKEGWGASNPNHRTPSGTHGPSLRGEGRCGENGSSRNKRSVWTIATQPYPDAHFATFPEEIPKLCILAGTSAKGCCASCGAPWERVVERTPYSPPTAMNGERFVDDSRNDKNRKLDGKSAEWLESAKTKTLGWQPTCKCEAGIEPCTVLDPFAGSGTTGAVALELGRKAILIELNPKYCDLIEQRCDVTMGLALA